MANQTVPMPYRVELTADEYRSLQWLEDHGYSGDMIRHATREALREDGGISLWYRESDAWGVQEAYEDDPHAFGACATPELRAKMFAFLDSIV